MAPRGRPRKGQLRKDAAFDAMLCYGFPKELILNTIKELLNVYGEDGWSFVEEASHKVLLDAILEKVEQQTQPVAVALPEDDRFGSNTVTPESYPSGGVLVPISSDVEASPMTSEANEVPHTALPAANTSPHTDDEAPETALPADECLKNNNRSPQRVINFPERVDSIPLPKRPYHGWICGTCTCDEHLIDLPPLPLPDKIQQVLRKSRKRRWDERPHI